MIKTYTNCYQTLDSNLEKGIVYFELDFLFTSEIFHLMFTPLIQLRPRRNIPLTVLQRFIPIFWTPINLISSPQ